MISIGRMVAVLIHLLNITVGHIHGQRKKLVLYAIYVWNAISHFALPIIQLVLDLVRLFIIHGVMLDTIHLIILS